MKKVLVRVDWNVPLNESLEVVDDTKIRSSLKFIQKLLEEDQVVVILTSIGRPNGTIVEKLRVDPVYNKLKELLKGLLPAVSIIKLNDSIGEEVRLQIDKFSKINTKGIVMLENVRFYQEELDNDTGFAQSLAKLGDSYINDAFSVCHRKQASVHAITKFLPSTPGPNLIKEVHYLEKLKDEKAVWILGGGKLDKLKILEIALKKADKVLLGGALPFAFMKAQGIPVGMSKVTDEAVSEAKKILKMKESKNIVLPVDFVVSEKISTRVESKIVGVNEIESGKIALDLGPKTVELFKQHLRGAKEVFWNGPLGYFEINDFARATKEIGRFIGGLNCLRIAGGGETVTALNKFQMGHLFDHVSLGGGATLKFLAGEKLPGLLVLQKANLGKKIVQLNSYQD